MADRTPRFGFTTFDSTKDVFDYHDYKFSDADRELLDRILTQVADRHVHTGTVAPPLETPGAAPQVSARTTGGLLPANRAVYYRVSTVDERGQEHVASQAAVVYTAAPIFAPGPFLLQPSTGVLLPGDYVYAISAYTDSPQCETSLSRASTGLLSRIGGFVLQFAGAPAGATGYNVYRKGPTDRQLTFVASVPEFYSTWNDDGTAHGNSLRGVPVANTTRSSNSITITPTVAPTTGQTWKVYRTFSPTNWDRSLLVWTAVWPVVDTGQATQAGSPPDAGAAVGNPPKVDLADETVGVPPVALTNPSTVVDFTVPGLVTPGVGTWQWVNEFDQARVLSMRACLGRGSAPAAQSVQVALERRTVGGSTWERYQDADALIDLLAEIPVGEQFGVDLAIPETAPAGLLGPGDRLRIAVVQSGGGATPTDSDLALTVMLAVRQGSGTLTYVWET